MTTAWARSVGLKIPQVDRVNRRSLVQIVRFKKGYSENDMCPSTWLHGGGFLQSTVVEDSKHGSSTVVRSGTVDEFEDCYF